MIQKISVSSLNSQSKQNPNFKGIDGAILGGTLATLQACEKIPMLNVAVLDLSTAIVPRTVVEGQTNPYAGLEAFRRESSGLIVNCMIPGFIVYAIAKAIQGDTKLANCWANEDTINLITDYWKNAPETVIDNEKLFAKDPQKALKSKTYNTLKALIQNTEGVDGDDIVKFSSVSTDDEIRQITENIFSEKYVKANKKAVSEAYHSIIEKSHADENIKIRQLLGKNEKTADKYFSQSFSSIMDNAPKIIREFIEGKAPAATIAEKAKHLVTSKSLLGLGVVLPLAISMQPINRWITEKTSGRKGAPIYKDFTHAGNKELTPKEKSDLRKQKLISISTMVGVALLSMMKKPSLEMLKFKNIFPSMDQARIISTATFASRMASSQDKNDLREATSRDIATFLSFYFIGDYIAKGIATLLEKTNNAKSKGIKLINDLKPISKDAGLWEKFVHWTKGTALKSSSEVHGLTKEATKEARNLRSLCQLGNIAFSMIALGIIIPKVYRKKTEKEHEKEIKQMSTAPQEIK